MYLVDMGVIAYLWRPTANNRRFAMSEELAQDDDGFEIASLADSEDGDEEEGRARATSGVTPIPEGRPLQNLAPAAVPPQGRRSMDRGRDSVEETMFSVGEEVDEWSDNESVSEGEGKRLTGRKHE